MVVAVTRFDWRALENDLADALVRAVSALVADRHDERFYAAALWLLYRETDGPIRLPMLAVNTEQALGRLPADERDDLRWSPADWEYDDVDWLSGDVARRWEHDLAAHARRGTVAQWDATFDRFVTALVTVCRRARRGLGGLPVVVLDAELHATVVPRILTKAETRRMFPELDEQTRARSELAALPPDAQVGLFVTSPGTKTRTVRVSAGATSSGPEIVQSTATFDNVTVTPAGPADWAALDVGPVPTQVAGGPVPGSSSRDGDTFTLTGAGNIGTLPPGGDDDIVRNSLVGTTMALIVVVVLGALVVTSEYSKGLIRTTFTVSPRRRAVLVAKGLVLTAVVFVLGSVTSFAALVFTRPTQRENGYVAPAYPDPSLTDGPVLRAVLGTGLLLAVFALIAMGVGVLVRRASVAITLVLALIIVPGVVNPFLSIEAELWVNRLTPMAGMAIQQTRERFDNPMDPWPGFGVLCAYAAVVLLLALWRLPRRDA
ncbi:hypothetical protein GCM10009558_084080 [Virgisporangium aurantiacum]